MSINQPKRGVLLLISAAALLTFVALGIAQANTETSSGWDPVTADSSIQFSAKLNADGSVTANWSKYSHAETFTYYKLVRSQTNSSPAYPEDGYIYYGGDVNTLTYTDQEVPEGTNYYRICQIASPKRYCSATVVKIEAATGTAEVVVDPVVTSEEKPVPTLYETPATNTIPNPSKIFPDLPADHWALSCIDRLKTAGVTTGNGEGNFEPEKAVNRAEFAKMVMEAYYPSGEMLPNETDQCFRDIDTGAWYAPYVCTAKVKGIIQGYTDQTFWPSYSIKRAEGVSIIVRTLGLSQTATSTPFRDVMEAWQVKLIGTAVEKGLVKGYTATTFGPNDSLTKAQAAQMICNALDVQSEAHPENNPPVEIPVEPTVVPPADQPTDIGTPSARSEALIIGHSNTDLSKIPSEFIAAAQDKLRIAYGHTSHGSQLTSGMSLLTAMSSVNYGYSSDGAGGSLYYNESVLSGDLGGDWDTQTRNLLSQTSNKINLVMWSWCGQLSSMSTAEVSSYLTKMNQLEQDFPAVTFVYFTGHLDGSGESGTLHRNNEQIRKFVRDNKKVLFDFADIESYDPSGAYFLNRGATDANDYDGGNWADQWCAANPGSPLCAQISCAHSTSLNCNLKGRATWWMLARLAGWEGM
jgi:hypothetical protein